MSGSLLEIKKKTTGVKNTRKITQAMQLVAASKMKQFQKRALTARSFSIDLLHMLSKNMTEDQKSVYTEQRETGKTLFVLYTSDKGLCGPLNNKLINALFRSNKWKSLTEDERLLITIGKKSYSYALNNKIPVVKQFVGLPEKPSTLDMFNIVDSVLQLWVNGVGNEENEDDEQEQEPIKEVILIAPHYKNSFTFYPVMKTFLPFTQESVQKNLQIPEQDMVEIPSEKVKEEIEESYEYGEPEEYVTEEFKEYSEEEDSYMLYNPSQEEVVKKLYELIVQGMFVQAFLELKASEYSSRMIAMQNATEAADKMINELNRVYNKARQQAITQEIAELLGASMALED